MYRRRTVDGTRVGRVAGVMQEAVENRYGRLPVRVVGGPQELGDRLVCAARE
jgi:hypothetical protein